MIVARRAYRGSMNVAHHIRSVRLRGWSGRHGSPGAGYVGFGARMHLAAATMPHLPTIDIVRTQDVGLTGADDPTVLGSGG
jgi:hypothetical protein